MISLQSLGNRYGLPYIGVAAASSTSYSISRNWSSLRVLSSAFRATWRPMRAFSYMIVAYGFSLSSSLACLAISSASAQRSCLTSLLYSSTRSANSCSTRILYCCSMIDLVLDCSDCVPAEPRPARASFCRASISGLRAGEQVQQRSDRVRTQVRFLDVVDRRRRGSSRPCRVRPPADARP